MADSVLKEILRNAKARDGSYATALSQVSSEVTVVAAPGAGKRIYVHQITISCINTDGTGHASIQIRDGTGGTSMLTIRCKASTQIIHSASFGNDPLPLTANRALILLVSNVTTNHLTDVSVVYKAF